MSRSTLLTIAIALTASISLPGQTRSPKTPSIAIDSLAGRDSFELYCAPCHGTTGHGDGPVASELKTRPSDLTTLARRSAGAFPRDQVRDFIVGTGRALPAHGTTEMPVWGPMFRAFEADGRVRERITNLVSFVESIQQPSTAAGDPGSQLFRTYCASCHGEDARGTGAKADRLNHIPPDLTQFTRRNGGVFPRERLRRIVDGRDVDSHGNREMPGWGTGSTSTT